ncbi:transposase Tn3 [Legionella hackeliae]|nr:transposase Tn3 [Legionella hackeliae]
MRASNERLTILSEAEQAALYELPNFDDEQRLNYLNLTPEEQALMRSRSDLSSQIHCALQIGYFKAVHFFFRFEWEDVTEDVAFVLEQYFPGQACKTSIVTKHQYYAQCQIIARHFGYQMWSNEFEPILLQQIEQILRKDISPQFIIMELLAFLREKKIMRPGYSTLQKIISRALLNEKARLTTLIQTSLSDQNKRLLKNLLQEEETLSGLAELKRDAKDFKARMMDAERVKLEVIKPLYVMVKSFLPTLKLSHQNISYYASLVHYYTIHDLHQRIKPEQSYLYLLCYIWERYRQLSNNLMDAFCIHLKQFEDSLKIKAKEAHAQHVMSQQTELRSMRRMAKYFVADEVPDETRFGDIRQEVFTTVISKEKLQEQVGNIDEKDLAEIDFYWKTTDQEFHRYKLHLRPLLMTLDFSSVTEDSPWLAAINWLKTIFNSSKQLNQSPISDCPEKTLPKRFRAYLIDTNSKGKQRLNADRYEFWIYRQLKKRVKSGGLHLEDSIHYRSLQQELQEAFDKGALTAPLRVPALKQPIQQLLDLRFAELHQQWTNFNDAFTQGKLKHLNYDEKTKTLHFKKTNDQQDEMLQHQFYEQLPLCDIADVLRFVNSSSRYSAAFTHIQPRYSKIHVEENNLIATIIAQALNSGNLNMADISDIPYDTLFDTYQSRLRLQTLKQANDIISDDISKMPIFPLYSLDMFLLYAALDGQKYEVPRPTIKARYSKKYYGKGKGVVAYTMLYSHIPLQSDLIGAHDHESYYAFDIWYNNTSGITPNVLTGDMHIINKGNFAIMDWFGGNLYPRFTNLQTQTKHLYCGDNPKQYSDWTIQPVGQINRQLIEDEWPNIIRIIAALGLKEISQSILIKKLCNYTTDNRTRKAIFEYDKLIRSIYTLKYLQDRKMQRDVHRSQNRLESYHQLRAVIATTYGKKQLIGKNDRELEISNQCGRLIANAIIHYNSAILSRLKTKYEAEGNFKALSILKKISPVAWRHIHFRGHFIFSNNTKIIDLDSIVRNLVLQVSKNKIMNKNKQDMYEYAI